MKLQMKSKINFLMLAGLVGFNFACKTAQKTAEETKTDLRATLEKMPEDYGIDWLELKDPKAAKAFKKRIADRKISTVVGPLVKVIEALAREGKAVEALALVEKQFSKELSLIGKVTQTNYAALSNLDDAVEYNIIRTLSKDVSLAKLFNTKGTTLYKLREAANTNVDMPGASELLTSSSKNKATNLSKLIEDMQKSPEFVQNPEVLNKMINKSIEVFNETKQLGIPRTFIVEDTCSNIVTVAQAESITQMMDDYLRTIKSSNKACGLVEAWAIVKYQRQLGYEGLVAIERASQMPVCNYVPKKVGTFISENARADAQRLLASAPPSCPN